MKPLLSAALIAAVLISGCSSLSESAKAPFAGSTAASADVQASNAGQFPQETDLGKF